MKCVIALDQGTTSSRAVVVDQEGSVVSVAQQEFEQHFPRPGWVEHDPEEIWRKQASVAADAADEPRRSRRRCRRGRRGRQGGWG